MSNACWMLANRIWSNAFGYERNSLWLNLSDERNLVRVLPRHRAEHAERRGDARCSRLRSPASRCSRDRSRSGSARTTRRRNARCPDRPAESTRSRCRRAGRGRAATAGCRARAPADPTCRRRARRSRARAGAAAPSESSCTGAGAGRRASAPRISSMFDIVWTVPCVRSCQRPGILAPGRRESEVLHDRRGDAPRRPSPRSAAPAPPPRPPSSRARVAGCCGVNSWQQSWSGMIEIGYVPSRCASADDLVLVHADERPQDLAASSPRRSTVRFSSVCDATWPITSPVTSACARHVRASCSAIRSISRR